MRSGELTFFFPDFKASLLTPPTDRKKEQVMPKSRRRLSVYTEFVMSTSID